MASCSSSALFGVWANSESIMTKRKGRRPHNTFKKRVLVMREPYAEHLPLKEQQASLEEVGLGMQPNELIVDKSWSIQEVKQSILNLVHPNVAKALQETDFIFGKGAKQKLIVKIDVAKDATELEELVGQGMLVIFPKSELQDLPVLTDNEIKNEEDADG